MYFFDEEDKQEYQFLNESLFSPLFNKKNKETFEDLSERIKDIKEDIVESDAAKFYKNNKRFFNIGIDLLINWVKFGPIFGAAVVPFSLTVSFITILVKKSLKHIKNKSDANMIKENIKLYISYLTTIKMKNKNLTKKIDKTIDTLDECLNILTEE